MKRDFDLIRELLLHFEMKNSSGVEQRPEIDGYDDEVIGYHLRLMHDASFIRAELIKSTTSDRVVQVWPFELTWQGHEFLDTVRDEEVWRKILDVVAQKGGSMAFAVIQKIAAQLATGQMSP